MTNITVETLAILQRLQEWYENECNGDWEHTFGVKIETLDNPGWIVTIDLMETQWAAIEIGRTIRERSDRDWVQYEVTGGQFVGSGGPARLVELLVLFFEVIEGRAP